MPRAESSCDVRVERQAAADQPTSERRNKRTATPAVTLTQGKQSTLAAQEGEAQTLLLHPPLDLPPLLHPTDRVESRAPQASHTRSQTNAPFQRRLTRATCSRPMRRAGPGGKTKQKNEAPRRSKKQNRTRRKNSVTDNVMLMLYIPGLGR